MGKLRIVPSVCVNDCGGACPLSIYVEDGRIVKVAAREVGYPGFRPCSRGLLFHYRVYAPDRLQHPLKRVGERGDGKFVRISWDEALSQVAEKITGIGDRYGRASILSISGTAADGRLHNVGGLLRRFFSMAGGSTMAWGGHSYQGGYFASMATYGRILTGNERADLLNARMIILWGCNPAENIFGTETRWYLTQAKEKGIRIVLIDPRYTDTASTWATQWVPLRPGTDAALAVAMAYVIMVHKLHDQQFIDTYTFGFDKFKDYILGNEDGVPKTPAWAAEITGLPAEVIKNLALAYARNRPSAIIPGFAPGRTACGEQFHRAVTTLSVMTGNIGIPGGAVGCLDLNAAAVTTPETEDHLYMYTDVPQLPNPIDKGLPQHEYAVKGIRQHTVSRVHPARYWDAILNGKSGGYFSDIHMLYLVGGNSVNQLVGSGIAVEALRKLKFIVMHDMFLTPTARFADIILPAATWCERNDIRLPWFFGHYAFFANKAIEPVGEAKTDLDIFTALASKMGITGYNDKTEDEWLRLIADRHEIPDYEEFKAKGFYKLNKPPYVAFEKQIKDPAHHPFPTPSGKIEIFSQRLADFNRPDEIPSVPKYVEGWEGITDPKRERYPLQFLTPHSRRRVHSQFHNIPWFRQMEPHEVWLNPVDAQARKIKDKDMVRVFNDRGTVLIPAKVTGRIMPGVVSIYEGAWYQPDVSGVDRGGSANVLTRGEHSPGGAFVTNTTLVEVEKAKR